uniref:Uncharacterized protein n=1 Tax=Panagrolaimus superbus TaxID=310955 RepID=A0A914YEY4_9BILA
MSFSSSSSSSQSPEIIFCEDRNLRWNAERLKQPAGRFGSNPAIERRVFVQQTPSEQFTQLIEAPIPSVAQSQDGEAPAPFAVYDYLRIKDDHQQQPEIPEYDPRGRPQRRSPRHSESPDYFGPSPPPPPQYFDPRDPRGLSPRGFDPRGLRPGGADPRQQFDPRGFDPRSDPRYPGSPDQFRPRSAPPNGNFGPPGGGQIRPTQDELRELIQKQLPPGVKLPPGINPEDLLFVLPPPYHASHGPPRDPRTLQDPRNQMPPPPKQQQQPQQRASSSSPTTEKRRQQLQPQDKGETPSQNGYHPPKKDDSSDSSQQPPPLRLVRGERRDIEEEIANRILSDISEENSIAGSLASLDDVEPLLKFNNVSKTHLGPTFF